jgi:hypothetical protein
VRRVHRLRDGKTAVRPGATLDKSDIPSEPPSRVLQGGLAGQPKILDFGVARIHDTDVQTQRQTDLGQLIGTLAYT